MQTLFLLGGLALSTLASTMMAPSGMEERPRLAVLDLSVGDKISTALAHRLSLSFRNAILTHPTFRTVTGPELRALVTMPISTSPLNTMPLDEARVSCADLDCAKAVAEQSQTAWVVFGRLRMADGEPFLEGFVYHRAQGRLLGHRQLKGAQALDSQSTARLSEELLSSAEASAGLSAPLWLQSVTFGFGAAMVTGGLLFSVLGASLTVFASWAFLSSALDMPTRLSARLVAGTAALGTGVAAVFAVVGTGLMVTSYVFDAE